MDNQVELIVLRPTSDIVAEEVEIVSREEKEEIDRSETKQVIGLSRRLDTLEGKTIGLFWNNKPNGDVFLNRIGELLVEQFNNIEIIRYFLGKPTVTNPSPPPAIREVAEKCDGLINSLGD